MAETITNGSVTVNFIDLQGHIDPPGYQQVEITRPAADGVAFRRIGSKGERFTLRGIADSTSSTTETASYKALQGTICSITHRGGSYTNYLCTKARTLGLKQVANAVGGLTGGTWLVEGEFEFIYAGES